MRAAEGSVLKKEMKGESKIYIFRSIALCKINFVSWEMKVLAKGIF